MAVLTAGQVNVILGMDTSRVKRGFREVNRDIEKSIIRFRAVGQAALFMGKSMAIAAAVGATPLAATLVPAGGAAVAAIPAFVGLGTAIGTVALASRGMGKALKDGIAAMSGGKEEAKKYRDALKQLHPEAQKTVQAMLGIVKNFQGFGRRLQGTLFGDFDQLLRSLNSIIPTVQRGMLGMAFVMNDLAKAGAKMITSGPWRKDIQVLMGTGNFMIEQMGKALLDIFDILRNIATAGAPFSRWLVMQLSSWTENLRITVQNARESGKLARAFETVKEATKRLFGVLGFLWDVSVRIVRALYNLGESMIEVYNNSELLKGAVHDLKTEGDKLKDMFAQAVIALGGFVIGVKVAEWIKNISGALRIMFGIIAANPITLLVGGIIALVGWLLYLNRNTEGVQKAWQNLQDLFKRFTEYFKSEVLPKWQEAGKFFMEKMKPAFEDVGNTVTDVLWPAIKPLIPWIKEAGKWILETLIPAWIKWEGFLLSNAIRVFAIGLDALIVALTGLAVVVTQTAKVMVGIWNFMADRFLANIGIILKAAAEVAEFMPGDFGNSIIDASKSFDEFHRAAKSEMEGMQRNVTDIADGTLKHFKETWNNAKDDAVQGAKDIGKSFKPNFDPAKEAARSYADSFNQSLSTIHSRKIDVTGHAALTAKEEMIKTWITARMKAGRMATGGPVRGQGGPRQDNIPMWLSSGEYVVNATATSRHRNLLDQINAGGMAMGGLVVKPSFSSTAAQQSRGFDAGLGRVAKIMQDGLTTAMKDLLKNIFAAGPGIQRALSWARSQVGKPYIWGGVGPAGYDCSGFMSAITNIILGRNPHRRLFATGSFPTKGWTPGFVVPGFNIGNRRAGGSMGIGHMAGTLGGVNVESRGGRGVVVGGSARGAKNSLFSGIWHLVGGSGSPGGNEKFPGFANGAYRVYGTGPAILHQDEMVLAPRIAAAVRASLRGAPMSSDGILVSVTINTTGGVSAEDGRRVGEEAASKLLALLRGRGSGL